MGTLYFGAGAAEGPAEEAAPDFGVPTLLDGVSERLGAMHRHQVHRDPWPDFAAFDRDAYPFALRRAAAVQWAGRARNEHGSVHQFSALLHAFSEARAPVEMLGPLTRLLTDEVRHAELCAAMALACDPEGPEREPAVFRFAVPRAPWRDAPRPARDSEEPPVRLYAWAADAVLTACCIGETLSRPLLAAVETVATEPTAAAVAAQILRDEHLHASFGWEALTWLVPRLDDEGRAFLREQLPRRFAGFERSTACGLRAEDVVDQELVIAPGEPNLGTLTKQAYAVIFFATFEQEILPGLRALDLDADWAWSARLSLL
ncbi:MAG: hypothetical protein R3B72_24075 [Polyangiaceae bacterium]